MAGRAFGEIARGSTEVGIRSWPAYCGGRRIKGRNPSFTVRWCPCTKEGIICTASSFGDDYVRRNLLSTVHQKAGQQSFRHDGRNDLSQAISSDHTLRGRYYPQGTYT